MIKLPISQLPKTASTKELWNELVKIHNAIFLLADYSLPPANLSTITADNLSLGAAASTVIVTAGAVLTYGTFVYINSSNQAVPYANRYVTAVAVPGLAQQEPYNLAAPFMCVESANAGDPVKLVTRGIVYVPTTLVPGSYYGLVGTTLYAMTQYFVGRGSAGYYNRAAFRGIVGYALSPNHLLIKRFN